jgi:ketosteroid isomerase-like protein/predicted enzyme related to lactoylglutathione lyase
MTIPPFSGRWLILLFIVLPFAISCGGPATGKADAARRAPDAAAPVPRLHAGHVTFALDDVRMAGGSALERKALGEAIVQLLESWCALDAVSYRAWLTPEVTRINRVTGISRGIDAAIASLPREWEEMERPRGEVAVKLEIVDASLQFRGDHAEALYAIQVEGDDSIRWEFEDRWLVHQVFARGADGRYRLVHQALASDLDAEAEDASFDFDFALPVTDLRRAIDFYTPLIGKPYHVGENRAVFMIGAVRFTLDATGFRGYAAVRPSKPNGWAIFHVKNLDEVGPDLVESFLTASGDRAGIALDPAGNPFVLLEERFATNGPPPAPLAAPAETPRAVSEALSRWLKADGAGYAAAFAPTAWRFENARGNLGVVTRGRNAIREAARRSWRGYDRSRAGLSARVAIIDLVVRPVGDRSLATYRLTVEGTGPHPSREELFVTEIIKGDRLLSSFAVRRLPEGMVREFDYIGYPVENLRAADHVARARVQRGGDLRGVDALDALARVSRVRSDLHQRRVEGRNPRPARRRV